MRSDVDFDLLSEVLDSIDDCYCVVDSHGSIQLENKYFREMVAGAHHERIRNEIRQLTLVVLFRGDGTVRTTGSATGRLSEFCVGQRTFRARASLMRRAPDDASALVLITLETITRVAPALGAKHRLTPREVEVVELLAEGHSNKRVAEALGVSTHTARHHTGRVLSKLQAKGRAEVGALVRRLHR